MILKLSLYGLFTSALIFISYCYLDHPIVELVAELNVSHSLFSYFSHITPLLQAGVVIYFIYALYKFRHGQKHSFAIALAFVSSLTTGLIIRYLGKISIGRTWPDTWVNNNPSWLQNGIDTFDPFNGGLAYQSFPSGHALLTFAILGLAWKLWPQSRPICTLLTALVTSGLILMNYHYLSDILAGSLLGFYCACLSYWIYHRHLITKWPR